MIFGANLGEARTDPNTFKAAEDVIDTITDIVDEKLDSAGFKDLRDALERLGKVIGMVSWG